LGPLLGILSNSFFSDSDLTSPLIYVIPRNPTLERYQSAFTILNYFPTLGKNLLFIAAVTVIQVMVCSLTGYGFARFDFPAKKLLFACVIIMIVVPVYPLALYWLVTFKYFDPLWLVSFFTGGPVNLLSSPAPIFIMTALGCGLRAGLYIVIFNQFFRGLPKELEEAALVDGAGALYTYFRIMLVNATPALLTTTLFSIVWQYNDTSLAGLFGLSVEMNIARRLLTVPAQFLYVLNVGQPIIRLYTCAGIVLTMLPIVAIYVLLQRRFIEGIERSGIVG